MTTAASACQAVFGSPPHAVRGDGAHPLDSPPVSVCAVRVMCQNLCVS